MEADGRQAVSAVSAEGEKEDDRAMRVDIETF